MPLALAVHKFLAVILLVSASVRICYEFLTENQYCFHLTVPKISPPE